MWPSLLALFGVVIIAIIFLYLFLVPLIEVIINMAFLYFIFIYAYTQVTKYKRLDTYIIALIGGIFIAVLTGPVGPFWRLTIAVIFAIILAKLYYWHRR